jgi:magnesium chelatase family protein
MLIKIYGSAIYRVAVQTITIEVNVDTGEIVNYKRK